MSADTRGDSSSVGRWCNVPPEVTDGEVWDGMLACPSCSTIACIEIMFTDGEPVEQGQTVRVEHDCGGIANVLVGVTVGP